MKIERLVAFLCVVLLALVGCAPSAMFEPAPLNFVVRFRQALDGSTVVQLGYQRPEEAGALMSGIEQAVGVAELYDAEDRVIGRVWFPHLGQSVAVFDRETPSRYTVIEAEWHIDPAPDRYRLIWGAYDVGFTNVDFELVRQGEVLAVTDQVSWPLEMSNKGGGADIEDYIAHVRPVVDLARKDLAEKLGVSAAGILAQRVEAVEFSDASLGVPEPGTTYAQVVTPGYVIQLLAPDAKMYEYHGSGDRVVLVPQVHSTSAEGEDQIVIQRVRVTSEQVTFTGRSTLPQDACLWTQLFVDDEPVPWWPTASCVLVLDDDWQVAVPLGKDGAPDALDATVQYELRVWDRDAPSVNATFWFDLAGPAS